MQTNWKRHRFEIAVVGAIIIGLWLVFNWRVREVRRGELCQANLKRVGLAMLIYVRDYDEKFPIAQRWSKDLQPYTRFNKPDYSTEDKTILQCPSVWQNGYSFNEYLDGIEFTQPANPSLTPMFFESSVLQNSQHDAGTSWLSTPRHPQGTALVFVDAHVEWRQTPPQFKPVLLPPRR